MTYPEAAIFKMFYIFLLVTLVMKVKERETTQASNNIKLSKNSVFGKSIVNYT